jgi:hypothetical protein
MRAVEEGRRSRKQRYGRRNLSRWPHDTLYQQKLALTSPTSGGRSVVIVRSRTQAMEFVFLFEEGRQLAIIHNGGLANDP